MYYLNINLQTLNTILAGTIGMVAGQNRFICTLEGFQEKGFTKWYQ